MVNNHWKNKGWLWGSVLLLLLFIAVPVYAQLFPPSSSPNDFVGPPDSLAPDVSANLVPCGQTGGRPCGYQDFLQLIKNIFDYLVKFAIPLAVGVIVIGGVIMMTAGTNEGKRSEAKKIIQMAVWGLVIVLASYLIVKVVFDFLVKPESIPDNFKTR